MTLSTRDGEGEVEVLNAVVIIGERDARVERNAQEPVLHGT